MNEPVLRPQSMFRGLLLLSCLAGFACNPNGTVPSPGSQALTGADDGGTPPDGGGGPAITASPAMLGPGGAITGTVSGGPGNRTDWVALMPKGAADNPAGVIDWFYLNGMKSPPDTGLTMATLNFTAPSMPGTYNLRFYANDGYTLLATSNDITVSAGTPMVSAMPAMAMPGGMETVTVTGDPGGRTDWVALELKGAPDNPSGVIDWFYLNGSKTPPATGVTMATLNFTMPMNGGTYVFKLYANDGYTVLATSNDVTVPTMYNPMISASPSSASPGAPITVTVTGDPGGRTDWVALEMQGAPDNPGSVIDWFYLNGSKTAPLMGVHNATLTFTLPMTPGTYVFKLYANDGYTVLATSNPVTAVVPTVMVSTTTAMPGQMVTVTVMNGPGNPTDWVALAQHGANIRVLLDWQYLNGMQTPPAMGLTSATLTFTMPTTPGQYEFRFFANDRFTLLATSPVITVM